MGCSADFAPYVQSSSPAVRLSGGVHGGQQPISGAEVLLYAAGTGGYGTPARSMLTTPVTTDPSGSFSITDDYTCQPGDQVYLVATGGSPGLSTNTNNSIALAAALGSCSALTSSTYISVNEVTTVAAAYALAGFMNAPTDLSSTGTPLALTGIRNAFLNAANLANVTSGSANGTTPGGNGTVPLAEINTLADILEACVNSTGAGAACSTLFTAATPPGGTAPTDTLTAALNIAHNSGQNVNPLFGLSAPAAPFQPSLASAPHDWSVAVTYTGGGIGNPPPTLENGIPIACCAPPSNHGVAIDGLGNVWVLNLPGVSVLDPAGNPLSPASGFTVGLLPFTDYEYTLAIDSANNAWIGAAVSDTAPDVRLIKVNSAGTLLSPAGGYTGGGLYTFDAMTFDSAGNLWVAGGETSDAAVEFSSTGAPISPASGYAADAAYTGDLFYPSLTADASGHVWWVGTEFGQGGTVLTTSGNCGGNSQNVVNAVDADGNMWTPYPYAPPVLYKCSPTGALLSPSNGYPVSPVSGGSSGVAVDGSNRIWFFDHNYGGRLGAMDTAGNLIAPAGGYQMEQDTGNPAQYMALDPSGNVWLSNNGPTLVEFVGIATPVVTPLATALATNSLGARP